MTALIAIYIAVLGAAMGSFAGAVAWRLEKGRDFVRERSECEHCHHVLSWTDLVPVVSCGVFIVYDLFSMLGGSNRRWLVLPEAVVLIPALLVILVAFASIVGMNLSLRQKTTVRAVMISLAIVIGLFALLGFCGTQLATNGEEVGLVLGSFSPLTVIMLLIDPVQFGGGMFLRGNSSEESTARLIVFLFALAACAGYGAVIWGMYKSMVKNFDMTIRRQQR